MNIHTIGQAVEPITVFYLALKLKIYPNMRWQHVNGGWEGNRLPLVIETKEYKWVYSIAGVACDVYRIVTGLGEWQSEWPTTRYPNFKAGPVEPRYHTLPIQVWRWLGYGASVSPDWNWLREPVPEMDHEIMADRIIRTQSRYNQVINDILSLYGERLEPALLTGG